MNRSRQSGFSLLEVMITVFVVAVGLLSVAGLQALSKKSNYDAVQRTLASALAQDLIERMRANPSQGSAYVAAAANGIDELHAPSAPGVDCMAGSSSAAVCTPAQMVSFDLYQWSRALFGKVESVTSGSGASATEAFTGGLTEATACVVNPAAPCGVYTITVAWRGITPLPKAGTDEAGTAVASSCGVDSDAYKPVDQSDQATKTLRRVVVMNTVIDDRNGTCATTPAT